MTDIHQLYASLLINYCLQIKPGDQLFIQSTYLAEPLLNEVMNEAYKAGAHPFLMVDLNTPEDPLLTYGQDYQLQYQSPIRKLLYEKFDAYLHIRAPFPMPQNKTVYDVAKQKALQVAQADLNKLYYERTGNGSMRRCLCQYPTQAAAAIAGMSLPDYEKFVFTACGLYETDPVEYWLGFRKRQQTYVDYLNKVSNMQYRSSNMDISFSVKGRTWINSDGRANMPSGEVFSAPVEDSVNGHVTFSFPSVYNGHDVDGATLEVKDGYITNWSASTGKEILDKVFETEGARRFGEVAIGTNYNIQRITRNILFDEKIGGSIHMAVGQSYKQCGGKNESLVHWDLINDMKSGGEIIADGEVIYRNGEFLI